MNLPSRDGQENSLDEWTELSFSQAVQVNPTTPLKKGEDYPFVDMAAVNPDSRSAYQSEIRPFKGSGSRFQHGDTLMARITPCLENGKIARYSAPEGNKEGHGSTEFIVIRGRDGVTDNDFAYYLTQWEEVRNYAIGQMTGTSGRQRVPADSLNHLVVPIPPLEEQKAIAHILGTLDDKIELNRRMNRTLEEMARVIFQDWFVDFGPTRAKMEGQEPYLPDELWNLFPDQLVDSELGEIPEGWGIEPLGEIIELAYGKALKAGDRRGGAVPVYGSNGQVGWHNENLVDGPGIIVGRKGNPGTVTWSHNDFFPIDTAFYVVPENPDPALHFLYHTLIEQDLPSVAADSAVPGLNRNLAYMNQLLIPNRSLMEIYDSYVEEMYIRMKLLEKESNDLALLRDALLPRLLSRNIMLEEG